MEQWITSSTARRWRIRVAAGGKAGARHVMEFLRDELDLALALSGSATVADIDASLVVRRREVA